MRAAREDGMNAKYLHIDLCAGLGGWKQPFKESPQWRSVGVDIEPKDGADILGDVRQLPLKRCEPDLLTMSPPCTEFSRYDMPWYDDEDPDMELVNSCLAAVGYLCPDWWIMENVQGLHKYWHPAVTWRGAWYLWGEFPLTDFPDGMPTKQKHCGEQYDRRAKIPYALADALRRSVEWYL